MNISEANKLLKDLQLEFEHTDLKTVRFSTVYILSNSSTQAIKRASLRGRLTEFFSSPESETERERDIRKAAAHALNVLNQAKENASAAPQNLAETRWRIRLQNQLRRENLLKDEAKSHEAPEDIPASDKLNNFQQLHAAALDKKLKEEQKEIKEYSLLQRKLTPASYNHLPPEERLKRATDEFKTRTDISGDITSSSIEAYWKALTQENLTDASVNRRLNFFKHAKHEQKLLQDKYLLNKGLTSTQRLEGYAKDAKDIESEVQKLEEGESWIFMGSCGQKEVHLDKLFSLHEYIPDHVKKELKKPAQRLLSMEEFPEPKDFMDEFIDRMDAFADQLPLRFRELFPDRVTALYDQVDQRGIFQTARLGLETCAGLKLPNILVDHLPARLKGKLDGDLKDGFLGTLALLSQLVPESETQELLETIMQVLDVADAPYKERLANVLWVIGWFPREAGVEYLRSIVNGLLKVNNDTQRAELRSNAKAWTKETAAQFIEGKNAEINAIVTDFFYRIRSKIPTQLMSYLDPQGYFTFSHFWVECIKETGGTFTVRIYPSQALLKMHYGDAEKVQWPLVVENVKSEKLCQEFFYKLLFQTIEPQLNTDYNVKGEDFYTSILEYFADKSFVEKLEDLPGKALDYIHAKVNSTIPSGLNPVYSLWVDRHEDFASEMGLVKLIATPRTVSPALVTLTNYFDALTEFCRSIPRANSFLEIPDQATCKTLEGFIRTGMQEVEKQKKFLTEKQYRSYKATKTEILQAIHRFKIKNVPQVEEKQPAQSLNDLHLPEPVLQTVKSTFHHAKIDGAYIRFLKPVLAWSLGEEVGDFIDALADCVGPLPKGEAIKPVNHKMIGEKGWLLDALSEGYRYYAIMILKAALTSLQYLHGTSLSRIAFTNTFTINSLLRKKLPNVHAWLWQVFGMLVQKFLQGIRYLLLRCIMNPEQINQLKTAVDAWKNTVKRLAEHGLGNEKVSFDLTGVHEELKKALEPHLRVKFARDARGNPSNRLLAGLPIPTALHPTDLLRSLKKLNRAFGKIQPKSRSPDPSVSSGATGPVVPSQTSSVDGSASAAPLADDALSGPKESPAKQMVDLLFEQAAELKSELELGKFQPAKKVDTTDTAPPVNRNPQLCQYVINVINKLPVPVVGSDNYWDAIPNPDLCLYELAVLAENLSAVSEHHSLDAETTGAATVSMYALFVMMDKLRRRLPELHLEDYNFDYFDFVVWVQKRNSRIGDPVINERMHQILHFYGLSYDQLPPTLEIQKRTTEEVVKLRSSLMFSEIEDNLEFACHVEERYLLARIKDPQVLEKLLKGSLNLTSFKALIDASDVVKQSMIKLLIQFRYQGELTRDHIHEIKKTVPQRGEKPEPSPEEYVEWFDAIMQAVHEAEWAQKYPALNQLLNTFFINKTEQIDILRCDAADTKPRYMLDKAFVLLKKQLLRCKRYVNKSLSTAVSRTYAKSEHGQLWYVRDHEPKDPLEYLSIMFPKNVDHTPQQKSESEIMHSATDSKLPKGLQLALSEQSESIMRAVGFFQANKEQFENVDCYQVFSDILFECGRLTYLISKQPHLSSYIARSFTELYQFYLDRSQPMVALRALYLQRKVAAIMQKYAQEPLDSVALSDLDAIEKSLTGNFNEILAFHSFRCLICSEKEQELAVSLSVSKLLTEDSKTDRMQDEAEERFWKNLPAIDRHFSDPANVQITIQSLLKALKIFSPELVNSLKWTRSGESLVFASGEYEIDLVQGTIKHMPSNKDLIKYVKAIRASVQRENVPDPDSLRMTDLNHFRSMESKIELLVKEEGEYFVLNMTVEMDGRRFEFFRNNSEAFAGQSTWSEVANTANFSILTLPAKNYYEYRTAQALLFNTESQLIRVNPNRAFQSLLSLSRFCPVSLMDIYAAKGKNTVEKMVFKPFNLTFTIKHCQNELRAYSADLFPDFYISPKQFLPQLNIFGSYLLLENEAGDRKVLLPDSQWKSSILMHLLKNTGPWASPVIALISKYYVEEKNSFSVLSMNCEGQLMSDDPAGAGLLTALYLLNGQTKLAKRSCALFERLCKRVTLTEAAYMSLMPLLLFPIDVVEGLTLIRQKMLAAIEENQLAGLRPPVKLDAHIHALIAASIITDLTTKTTSPLSEFQEWFLFKGYFYHAAQAAQLSQSKINVPLNFIVEAISANIETFGLPDQFKRRFAFLEKKLGSKSFKDKAVKVIAKPQVLVRKVAELSSQSLPNLLGTFFNTLPIKVIAKVLLTPNPLPNDMFCRTEGLFKRCFNYVAPNMLSMSFDVRSLNLHSLIGDLQKDKKNVSFTFSKLNATEFTQGFLTYLEVACAGPSHPDWRALSQLLLLAKGGWNTQTKILIEILTAIFNQSWLSIQNPKLLFPSAKQFREVIFKRKNVAKKTSLEVEKQYPEMVEFLQSLINRMAGLRMASNFAAEGVQWYSNNLAKGTTIGLLGIPVMSVNPLSIPFLPSLTAVLTSNALSAGMLWWSEHTASAAPIQSKTSKALYTPDYGYLNTVDSFFNNARRAIFDLVFKVEEKRIPKNDLFEKLNIKELSDSYQEFYLRHGAYMQQFALTSERALWAAYCHLIELVNTYQEQLTDERNQIISIITKGIPKDPEETFARLKTCFSNGDFSDMLKGLELEPDLLRTLECAFARHLVCCTHVKQMARAVACLEELASETTSSPVLQSYKIQKFAEELCAKRNYQLSDVDLRLIRKALVFEYESNQAIWQKPFESVKKALLHKNAVIEQGSGTGKNHTFYTLVNAIIADGKKIAVNIFPSSMFEASFRKLNAQSQMFSQEANVLRFNRKAILSSEGLMALLAVFQRCLEFGESISMTLEDLKAIELLFIVKMNEYIQYGRSDDDKSGEILMQLAQVLRIFRTKCKLIGDEAHELFNYRRQLNYPIGSSNVIPSRDYTMIEACMEATAEILQEIRKNHEHGLSETDYLKKVAKPAAQKMVSHSFFKGLTSEQKQDLIEFFVQPEKGSAQWIKNHPLYREMSIVRGVLSYILFSTVNSILHVTYGPSLNNQGEYARPYEGNINPLENCSYVNPHANMVKTFVQFLQNGLDQEQLVKILSFLKQSIQKEMEYYNISSSETKGSALLNEVFAGISIDWTRPELIEKGKAALLMKHPKMVILYVRHFVQQQVRYWNESACSTSLDAAEMAESGVFVTATPKNHGTYPPQLEMQRDSGNMGEAIHMIHQKYTGYDVINATTPLEILKEVLRNVTQTEDFAVLGDCGPTPLLPGLSGEEVAKEMINFIKDNRISHIHGVVFFKKDAQGRNTAYYLGINANDVVPFESVKVKPENRWTYFDDNSGISADIPQKPNARIEVLFGQGTYLDKFTQMCNRLRGIKEIKRLVGFSDQMATQTVHISILKKLKHELVPHHEEIEFHHFIQRAHRNEAVDLEQGNFHAFPQKLHAKDRRARLDKVIKANSLDSMIDYFKEFRPYFIQTLEVDPVSLYAPLRLKRKPEKVCENLREQTFKTTETSLAFTSAEKEALKQARKEIKLHKMPEQVHAYYDGTVLKNGANHDLSQIAQVEHDHDIELDLHHQYDSDDLGAPFVESWSLTSAFDPHAENWLYFSSPQNQTFASAIKRAWNTSTPPLYAVTDLLQQSPQAIFKHVSAKFDPRIWVSNNYLPTSLNNAREKRAEIGSAIQRQALNIVVQIDETASSLEIVSTGCVSVKDASVLRANLDKYQPKGNRKTFIFDVQAKNIIAGPHIDRARLERTPAFIQMIAQLKFLSGSTDYTESELSYLDQWLEDSGREHMKEVFEQIYYARENAPLLGTKIDALLKKNRSAFEKL